ncbi:Protein disulfide-isomerase A4 [Folsomia candida]|uniref:protein disulfide-isomerase n=1 Tax=Folsomia candida TaxID=158441 RepID=A0A226EGJ7_FOLCA|nr:Protein disulfide-isomerase A4 [Folsomia candida]
MEKYLTGVSLLMLMAILPLEAGQEIKVDLGKNFVLNDGDVEIVDVDGNYDVQEEDNVLVLTAQNFKHVVHKHDFVLVEFYAPWCTHCKVDATIETILAKEYMITGFPTVILFHKGQKVEEYNGDRSAEGIVNYMKMRTSPDWKPPPTSVIELNGENFTQFMESKPLVMVLFYAEYCKHCVQIKPEYIKAASVLKEYGIPLTQIDGVNNKEIADEFKVSGWPTLYTFRYGRAFQYKGTRDANGIITYMKDQQKSPSDLCKTMQEMENRIDRYHPTIIGVFSSKKSPFYNEFLAVANYLREEPLKFIHTFDKSTIGKNLGVEDEAVIVRKPTVFLSDYEKSEAILTDATKTGDDIAEFIRKTYRPLVGQRTKKNQVYFYSVRPLVVIYYDANFDHQFTVANEDEFEQELQAVKLDDSGVDVNVVWYDKNRIKYKMDPVDDFDGSDLRKFVNQVQDGLLKPVWKSQPIPAKQEGPVANLVANSFSSEVLTTPGDRDVVFYIYAPWCGHCKKFDAIYKKLAKELGNDRLWFAKMDGTANDLPPGFDIKGYPTVFFIAAYKKHEPKLYEGDRSTSHFREFIKKESTIFLTDEEREGKNKVEL